MDDSFSAGELVIYTSYQLCGHCCSATHTHVISFFGYCAQGWGGGWIAIALPIAPAGYFVMAQYVMPRDVGHAAHGYYACFSDNVDNYCLLYFILVNDNENNIQNDGPT